MKLKKHSEKSKPVLSADTILSGPVRRVGDWVDHELAASLLLRIGSGGTRYIARAPGRLDVFGGISDYAGSLALMMPLTRHAVAALRPTDDGMLRVTSAEGPEVSLSWAKLQAMAKDPHGGELLCKKLTEIKATPDCLVAIGTVLECVRAGWLTTESTGFKLAVGTNLSSVSDSGESAATAAATLATLLRWARKELSGVEAVRLVQTVETRWLGRPVGVSDAMCALEADACLLSQMHTIGRHVAGMLAVPKDYAFIAIDTGVKRDPDLTKYGVVRTATQMGVYLIGRIIEYENSNGSHWEGWLAQLSSSEFTKRFRDRLPTKMKGSEFLKLFGDLSDPLVKIEPSFVYRVRSRTEHHVHECSRAVQFAQALARADRTEHDVALLEAGDSMYASHWSYGQRCGLGCVESDLMVKLLRDQGPAFDVIGAKLTGRGAGGVVMVLVRDTERARATVARSTEIYQNKTGIEPALIELGDTAGVHHTGVKLL